METTAKFIQDFRLEEYKALRSEILYQIQTIDGIKFWIVAAMAVYYSFIIAKFAKIKRDRVTLAGPVWIWLAPVLLPIFGYFRLSAHIRQLDIFAKYIRQIEDLYPGLPGWEHFYAQHRSEDVVWAFDEFYFLVLFLFSIGILLLRYGFRGTSDEAKLPGE
jgi:hypothetical protein